MLKMLSLFSGIGGFDIAARWTGQIETVAFVEIDPFCQKVLKKHWPTVPIISDIREVTGERIRGIVADTDGAGGGASQCGIDGNGQKENEGRDEFSQSEPCGRIDILTGGFPCQPFSCAGKRKGTSDNRFLWPEMLRVIKEVRPKWVIGENVAGLISIDNGMVFEDCCASLEAEGYAVQSFILPACSVGAPHRRDRVWIVAWSNADDTKGRGCGLLHTENFGKTTGEINTSCNADSPVANSRSITDKQNPRGCIGSIQEKPEDNARPGNTDSHAPDTDLPGSQGRDEYGQRAGEWTPGQGYTEQWEEDWCSVALRTCVRGMDDGVSRRLHRTDRLKALGNAVVPQIPYLIMKAILEVTP
jgi:DNA (cytosine-5)-methyltransferase 1